MTNKFYLTTPLYYVNDVPHIGHAYTTIAADVLARYKRAMGFDVHFLTGTDEHGEKIWRAAAEAKKDTQAFVDQMAAGFKSAWQTLGITNDDFIRTTEKRHESTVQKIFSRLLQQGDIYKGEYEGWYCVPCESFWSELELLEGKVCPDCGRKTEILKEETYFFILSKYQDKLLRHIEDNPSFIQPDSRRNEILQFIKQGLKDLSVTRTAFPWGVGVPGDDKHVIYVWFDALINYVSALGYNPEDNSFQKPVWPAAVHLMGKEIVRFHAVTWPCMLMALGLELPKKVFGHGWWTVEGKKMSKSKGNVVDPLALSADRAFRQAGFGVDAVRYFLMKEVPFGVDGDFSKQSFINRYNADLANDLGNLLSRTLTMVEKYFESRIADRESRTFDDLSAEIVNLTAAAPQLVDKQMNDLAFSEALGVIWTLVSKANNYIEQEAPWKLAKAGETAKLQAVMFNLCEVLKVTAVLITPFMPATAARMWLQLGLSGLPSLQTPIAGVTVKKGEPLFPRIQK